MRKKDWKTRYFKPSEVVLHNKSNDCWVSLLGVVKDLTPLVQEYRNSPAVKPLLAEAGKDISHWFSENGDVQTYVHPVTGAVVPYLPHGKIPHIEEGYFPDTSWAPPVPQVPWWKEEKYNIGNLTKNVRPIRILNLLTQKEIVLNVCEEETIEQIRERYLPFNSNAKSYTWKFHRKKLNMKQTLAQNGIKDEKEKFRLLGLPEDLYIPCIMIYYDDIYE